MRADSGSRWYHQRPGLRDALLALVVLVVGLLVPASDGGVNLLSGSAGPVVALVVACAAVAVRDRWPLASLAVATAATVVVIGGTSGHGPALLAVLFPLYTVALRAERRALLVSWAVSGGAMFAAAAVFRRQEPLVVDLSYVAWTAAAAAVGEGVRHRCAHIAAIEASLRQESQRQVVEERLRIARELHDVVAHQLAVVTVQAGVASHLLTSDPAAAQEALHHVTNAGRTVLEDLGGILSVLRDPDEATLAPSPGLDELDDLLASVKAAGLAVELSQHGLPRALASSVDLVAYRLLQEALTNAHKHGTGRARAAISYSPTSLSLSVTNPFHDGAPHRGGHGLVGMQERATAVGGQLTIGSSPSGVFTVEARLPIAATA